MILTEKNLVEKRLKSKRSDQMFRIFSLFILAVFSNVLRIIVGFSQYTAN